MDGWVPAQTARKQIPVDTTVLDGGYSMELARGCVKPKKGYRQRKVSTGPLSEVCFEFDGGCLERRELWPCHCGGQIPFLRETGCPKYPSRPLDGVELRRLWISAEIPASTQLPCFWPPNTNKRTTALSTVPRTLESGGKVVVKRQVREDLMERPKRLFLSVVLQRVGCR